jgi:hypothetical protein
VDVIYFRVHAANPSPWRFPLYVLGVASILLLIRQAFYEIEYPESNDEYLMSLEFSDRALATLLIVTATIILAYWYFVGIGCHVERPRKRMDGARSNEVHDGLGLETLDQQPKETETLQSY